jgi:hypothetical protein
MSDLAVLNQTSPPSPPYLLQEPTPRPGAPLVGEIEHGPDARPTEGAPVYTPLVGEVAPDDEDDNDVYAVTVKMNRMTWGDQMIHARFQLLIETIGDIDGDGGSEADEAAVARKKNERMSALRELIAGFDELTAFLDRVARVTRNGVRVPMRDVPMEFIEEVMDAIAKARQRKASAKN